MSDQDGRYIKLLLVFLCVMYNSCENTLLSRIDNFSPKIRFSFIIKSHTCLNSYHPPSESLLVVPITAFSTRPKLTLVSHENATSTSWTERLLAHKRAANDFIRFSSLQLLHLSTLVTFSFFIKFLCFFSHSARLQTSLNENSD